MANAAAVLPLSGSVQGKPIKVVAVATPGTPVHTTGTSATLVDRLYLWATNNHTADVVLTLEFGGVTVPDQAITVTIPFKAGLILLVEGQPLLGNGSVGLTVGAFASVASVVSIVGHLIRITP